MTLVNTNKMLNDANKKGYAICAFNIYNLESAMAAVESAAETKKPVILAVSESAAKYAGMKTLVSIVSALASEYKATVALHLDHGKSYQSCKQAIDCGFTSVMIDGSSLSLDENIKLTKKVVSYAHKHNVSVEAELGKIMGVEDLVSSKEQLYTDPEEAYSFVQQTGVDSLAISIGTAHGINKGLTTPKIQFETIKSINQILPSTPLVAHGSSSVPKEFVDIINNYGGKLNKTQGIPEKDVIKMSQIGINKINMDTDIRLAFTTAIRSEFTENPSTFDPRTYLGRAKTLAKEYMIKMINLLNK